MKSLKRRQSNAFSEKRIAVKIIAVIMLIVVPLNIVSILSSVELYKRYAVQVKMGLENIADVYMNTIDYHTEEADMYLFEILGNSEECGILKKTGIKDWEYENAKYRCYNRLSDRIRQEEIVSGYFIQTKKATDCIMALDSTLKPIAPGIRDFIDVKKMCDNQWHIVGINGQQLLLRIAEDKNFYYGSVINLSRQRELILQQRDYETLQVVFGEEIFIENRDNIQATAKSERMDLRLSISVSRQECYAGISFWYRAIIVATFLLIFAVPILCIYMTRLTVKPLNELNEGFCQIEHGNRNYTITDMAKTKEFQGAYQSFNRMVRSMENLRLDNIEKELKKNKLELDNLKLQIRPHFLMNTFNLMYYLLRSPEGIEAVRELILYLSDYFRYLFRSDRDKELFDKELNMIEGYIKTAKIRYPGGIDITYEIDPEVRLVRVPPLLIHDFVENVVKHGITADKCVHIILSAQYEAGHIQIEINDDGNGMSEEQVRIINEHLWTGDETEHLGVQNAYRRLEFLYGQEATVKVWSEIGRGTTFIISFPYELEVEE